GVMLCLAILLLLRRVPSDGGGVKQHLRAVQGGEARPLGIPLVPTNQSADLAELRFAGAEAQIAGSEIKLFVIERIVGNMHLAVYALDPAIGPQRHRCVVIDARSAP